MPIAPYRAGIAATVAAIEWRAAVHEAGHAVISCVLAIGCTEASIEHGKDSWGHVVTPDRWQVETAWDRAGKYRSTRSIPIATIVHLQAGHEAELAFGFDPIGGDGRDRELMKIELWFCCFGSGPRAAGRRERLERRLRNSAAHLVRRHARAIGAVARALIVRRKLDGERIAAIVEGCRGAGG